MKNRLSNFEFLRIILGLFIIINHILMYSEQLSNIGTIEYYISNFIRSFVICAVNIFIILAGYFGIKFNKFKLLKLECRLLVYSYLFILIGFIFDIYTFDYKNLIYLLFPLTTKQYWFITIYFILCVFSNYINSFLKSISDREIKHLLFLEIIIFYMIPTFAYLINAPQIVTDSGYGIINFICLYTVGYYIRHYYIDDKNIKKYVYLFLIVCILLYFSILILSYILGFYFDSFISYNSIFCLFSAILLFLIFKNSSFCYSKLINFLASKCIVVYIIHMNPVISQYLFKNTLNVDKLTGVRYILGIIILPIFIYIVCVLIDIIIEFFISTLYLIIRKINIKFIKE